MKLSFVAIVVVLAALASPADAFKTQAPLAVRRNGASCLKMFDPASAALAFALGTAPLNPPERVNFGSSIVQAETVTRQGLYKEYTTEINEKTESAAGTFKTKEATAKNQDKYTVVLAILLVGSFVIPMVQYWWYIKDDEIDEEL
mmetsp:Transcript_4013/g.5611  ORF Transcript_4013/g.5611 Transcript_4013/m.5611 type:complete len:145 (+) Transcript_4013:26-460(+)